VDPPQGLVTFCRTEWPRLVGALALYTGDPELAQEIAQETLARVARDWQRVSSLDAPGAWAHRVALNLARSHFRRLRVARAATARLEHASATNSVGGDPADAVAVRAAVAALPERQRRALVLRYFVDLPVGEVAAAMGCPEGTVKTLTSRALATLRRSGLVDPDPTIEPDERPGSGEPEGALDAG